MIIRKGGWNLPTLGLAVLISSSLAPALADSPTNKALAEIVQELMQKELTGVPGKELRMLTVEYPPGGASPPHRHHAQVFVYVLSGSLRMQVQGSPVVTLQPGQIFYEGLDDVHTISENASRSEPAKILVFMVKDKSAEEPRKATTGNTP
jgi:quercetin dioxygenase-like cupin family protein